MKPNTNPLKCPKCGTVLSYKRPLMSWGTLQRDEGTLVEEVWEDTDNAGDMEVFCIDLEECGFVVPPEATPRIVPYIDALAMYFFNERKRKEAADATK